MRDATRRQFLKTSSIGALAAGVLGALPIVVYAQDQAPATPPSPTSLAAGPALQVPAATSTSEAALTPFTVFVSGPPSNDAVIYIGEQAIPLTDPSVVQYLRQLAANA